MDDTIISRYSAIDAIEKAMCEDGFRSETGLIHKTTAYDIIRHLPSAQPERRKAEWIPEFDGKFTGGAYWFSCSKCKRIVPEVRNGGWNFCPNCGADMRGEGEE